MRYAALSYLTPNIGDEIQSLAAIQFLPRLDHTFLRDFPIFAPPAEPTRLIANGWYAHSIDFYIKMAALRLLRRPEPGAGKKTGNGSNRESRSKFFFPSAKSLKTLFTSIHLSEELLRNSSGIDAFLAEASRHGPVGARDFPTLEKLKSQGIDSYFSGCLTLTLGNSFQGAPRESREKYIFCDVPALDDSRIRALPDFVRANALFVTHQTTLLSRKRRFEAARSLLQEYSNAKMVVTSRLHCALPCIAMGTPVIFIVSNRDDPRFGGYESILKPFSSGEIDRILIGIDWRNPEATPRSAQLVEIEENHSKRCSEFILGK